MPLSLLHWLAATRTLTQADALRLTAWIEGTK